MRIKTRSFMSPSFRRNLNDEILRKYWRRLLVFTSNGSWTMGSSSDTGSSCEPEEDCGSSALLLSPSLCLPMEGEFPVLSSTTGKVLMLSPSLLLSAAIINGCGSAKGSDSVTASGVANVGSGPLGTSSSPCTGPPV